MKAEKAVHKHESHLHKGQPKTKFSSGGRTITNANLKKYGRNLARAKNQSGAK
jgi:hypothetical protein